ncbi:hypothetical protein BBJ28_00016337 [Nothophytophthora sp. Chile5]|nr:hypothetical protein BBJ28_00016337 [Nothophytophthora sp. Chile5]
MPKRKERDYPFRHSIASLFDKPDFAASAVTLRSDFAFGVDKHWRFVKLLRNLIPDAADSKARNVLQTLSELLLHRLNQVSELLSIYLDRQIWQYVTEGPRKRPRHH